MRRKHCARYEQFLLFPQCFQRACFPEASKGVIVWEWVKAKWIIVFSKKYPNFYHFILSQTCCGFYVPAVQVFLKTLWEKEKSLVMSNFSFSNTVIYLTGELYTIFIKFQLSSANSLSLEESKICCLGKG